MISLASQLFQQTPLGVLQIASDGFAITGVNFISGIIGEEGKMGKELFKYDADKPNKTNVKNGNTLIQLAIDQLNRYLFQGEQQFSLPLKVEGTPFQKRVWGALQKIPYGQTMTYGALAEQLNSSARAVGNACRRNPVPVFIPCHRVVARNGIGGYSGSTSGYLINRKQFLLDLELAQSSPSQLSLC